INNTRIENVAGSGIATGAIAANVMVDNTRIFGSKFGVAVGSGAKLLFSRSVTSFATTAGLEADAGGLTINDSLISFNPTAISGTSQSYDNNKIFGNTAAGTTPTLINAGSGATNPFGMN